MTREQLDLIIMYINAKVAIALHEAKHSNSPHYLTDNLVGILGQLEDSTEAA